MASHAHKELLPGPEAAWRSGSVAADVGLVVWFIFSLFPIVWMVMLALKNDRGADHHLLPVQPDLVELRDRGEPTRAPR